ncbi:MAG: hypothetical protein ACYYKD_02350 [Rhodospirillales bacterium]
MSKRNRFFLESKPSPLRDFLRGFGSVVDIMPEREFRPWEKSDALALYADGLAVRNDFYSAFKKAAADLKQRELVRDGTE